MLLKETHDSAYCVVVDKSFEREETQAVYPHYDARCFEIVLHDATFVQQNAFEPLGEGGVVFAGFIVQPTEQSSEVSDEVFQIENLRENRQHVGVEGAEVGDLDTPRRGVLLERGPSWICASSLALSSTSRASVTVSSGGISTSLDMSETLMIGSPFAAVGKPLMTLTLPF